MEGIPKFLMVQDVMEILSISKAKAYSIIRNLNDELTAQGYETLARRVPTKYFAEKFYCGEELLTPLVKPVSKSERRKKSGKTHCTAGHQVAAK